jgi:hypothetical protein
MLENYKITFVIICSKRQFIVYSFVFYLLSVDDSTLVRQFRKIFMFNWLPSIVLGSLLLSTSSYASTTTCQQLPLPLARKLPGWESLLAHARSLWGDFEEVHVNWEK